MNLPTVDVTRIRQLDSIESEKHFNLLSEKMIIRYNDCSAPKYRENLRTLMNWLAANEVLFDINSWRSDRVSVDTIEQCIKHNDLVVPSNHTKCGTSACAVGWAPFAIPGVNIQDYGADYGVEYSALCDDLFGDYPEMYSGLFSNTWVDMTVHVARVLYQEGLSRSLTHDVDKILFIFRAKMALDYDIIISDGINNDIEQNQLNDVGKEFVNLAIKFVRDFMVSAGKLQGKSL